MLKLARDFLVSVAVVFALIMGVVALQAMDGDGPNCFVVECE